MRPASRCRYRAGTRARSVWLKVLALALAVLACNAQQRAASAVYVAATSATRAVAERTPKAESNAVLTRAPQRVAPAPFLERVPVVSPGDARRPLPSPRLLVARAASGQRAQLVTHFHAKRRIPRMNSEEPPRG